MRIIGCDYHPGFQQIALWIPTQANAASGDCSTRKKLGSSIAIMVQAHTRVMNQLQAVALNESTLQEAVVAGSGTGAVGRVPVGAHGQAGGDAICWSCWTD
jgi:hypothetical protein